VTHPLFELSLEWDGICLTARTRTQDGWRLLSDMPTPRAGVHRAPCVDIEDMTAFELGVFLATACRDFTLSWEQAKLITHTADALWDVRAEGSP